MALRIDIHENATWNAGIRTVETVTVTVFGGMNRQGFLDQAKIGTVTPDQLPVALAAAQALVERPDQFERLAAAAQAYWAQPFTPRSLNADDIAWLAAAEKRGDALCAWLAQAEAESERGE